MMYCSYNNVATNMILKIYFNIITLTLAQPSFKYTPITARVDQLIHKAFCVEIIVTTFKNNELKYTQQLL